MNDAFSPSAAHPGKVLVVDDHADNLRILSLELRSQPFVLTLVDNPKEALALTETLPYEAILTDVSMPGMDGIELCRRIREGSLNAQTPLMFFSAMRTGEDWVTRGLEAGGMDYLPKPYSFVELLAKLRMMVRLSRQQQALAQTQRHQALLEVAGGAAHELSQPLASAQLVLERMERQSGPPTPEQVAKLRDLMDRTANILYQIQTLRTYVTKPYAQGQIMDLQESHRASGLHRVISDDE